MTESEPSGLPVTTLRKMVDEAIDLTTTARRLSERDRDYYDNFDASQWTAAEKEVLIRWGIGVIIVGAASGIVDMMLGKT